MAAEKAVEAVKDGMIVGLGTGSTALFAIQRLGERIKEGLKIEAVATSVRSEQLAREAGISLRPFAGMEAIDISIDGADEVDKKNNLIKGGGGALLREKLIAFNTKYYIIIVDESKLVDRLGAFPLPVEVLPFGAELTLQQLKKISGEARFRQVGGKNFATDNGHFIVDLPLFPINDPEETNNRLRNVTGVLETGLFLHHLVSAVYVGTKDGQVREIENEKQ